MLTLAQIAELAELSPETVRHYLKVANRARRQGTATERDMPAPAGQQDGANVWHQADIEAWLKARQTPAKRGAIPKSEMRDVLQAAESGNIDRVITIARRNMK